MAAETAVLVNIATSLASGLLKEVSKKALDAASESSTVAGLKSAIFGGLEPDLRRLEKELCLLNSVLRSAQSIDPMQRDNNDLLLLWLRDVKEAAFYADNLLDEIAYEKIRRKVQIETSVVAKLLSRSDTSFSFRMRIAGKIKEFVSLTAGIHKEAETTLNLAKLVGKASIATYQPPPTTISVTENLREIRENPDTSIVVGREADEELIVTKLCSPHNHPDLPVVALVGRSGVGKTTLARMVYDNKAVGEHYGKRAWIFVSDNFKLERFLDEMLQSVTGQSHNLSNKGAMEDKLQQCLQEEKKGYLLVLDDVWNTDEQLWKSVESSFVRVTRSTRCRVLVTTQSFDVARLMCASSSSSTHELNDLGDADAWALFKELAFANKTQEQLSDWENVGTRILSKCRGLPLAIKILGSLLRSMNEKSQWESVERSEIWGLSLHQSNIMPWLLISFHHLRDAAIKQCFVHCSVIIGKGEFVRQSEVIQAWMAQGFIQSTKESEMSIEDMGETYVSNLVANGLLQVDIQHDSRYGWIDGQVVCYLWMHDLVHDLARYISKATIRIAREACDFDTAFEAEHLRICGEGYRVSRYDLPRGKTLSKLRTLICRRATLSVDFAAQAKFLRDLRFIGYELEKVPSSIGRLKHLRYLRLSGKFSHLPESIGTLFNLQTLNVDGCFNLVELPREITMLVNLRHILTSWPYRETPKGMGQLIHLRTIPPIVLREKKGFEIKELKSLAFLSGGIGISGIEHISCKEDAVEASLKTKARITNLRLEWQSCEERLGNCNDEEIMEGLHPHSNLKGIVVEGFGGKRLSSWLLDMNNLKTVYLRSCYGCEQLPALGQLGSLEEIYISGMGSLEVIGIEFYEGRATTSSNSHKNSDTSRRRILFPRLKHLLLQNMKKLRDWVEPSGSIYEVFPCLEKLEIEDCPLLISAPTCFQSLLSLYIKDIRSGEAVMMILTNTSNLTDLKLRFVEQLTSLSHPLLKCSHSIKNLDISDCKELGELCASTFQRMASLETLGVSGCDRLASIPDVEGLPSLRTLSIRNCSSVGTIQGLESGVSMDELHLEGNSKLELMPDLKNLTRLTSLGVFDFSRQKSIPEWLSGLRSLRKLGIGGFSEEVEQLDGATHLPKCVKELTLHGWPKLNSLPSQLQYLNQLERLYMTRFAGIERLPEWLGGLSSLQTLYISGCENLKYLPSLDAMQRLTQLRSLSICGCPILRERCRKDGGEEWHKISHIDNLWLPDLEEELHSTEVKRGIRLSGCRMYGPHNSKPITSWAFLVNVPLPSFF